MIKNSEYISLEEVLSRVLRHPLMQKVDLEAAIQYAVDFIEAVGTPDMFQSKEEKVIIKDFRGTLPCDLVSVTQVKDLKTNTCLRSMTDNFMPTGNYSCRHSAGMYHYGEELTFKTQNTTIITSMPEGEVLVSYKAIPVDEDGKPLLLNNSTYLKALELYIKVEVFTILYDEDKIKPGPLQNAQQQYAWAVGKLQSELTIPSESEMESLCRSWTTMLQRTTEFDSGFKNNGNREYLRRH